MNAAAPDSWTIEMTHPDECVHCEAAADAAIDHCNEHGVDRATWIFTVPTYSAEALGSIVGSQQHEATVIRDERQS